MTRNSENKRRINGTYNHLKTSLLAPWRTLHFPSTVFKTRALESWSKLGSQNQHSVTG